jgi:hypothetical protein
MNASMQNRLRAYVLTPTAEIPAELLDVHPGGLTVRVQASESLGPDVRVGFVVDGERSGRLQLLASLIEVRLEMDAVRLSLEGKSLHTTDGRECLADFLQNVMHRSGGAGRVRGSDESGWFFDFGAGATLGPVYRTRDAASDRKQAPVLSEAEIEDANRCASRMLRRLGAPAGTIAGKTRGRNSGAIRVQLPAALHIGGDNRPGEIYRMSMDARELELRAVCTAPAQFESVAFVTSVRLRAKSYRVFATGTVSWVLNETSRAGEVAFGMRLSGTVAPDMIDTLREYVAIESGLELDVELRTGTGR